MLAVEFQFHPGDVVNVPSIGLSDAIVETCAVEQGMVHKYYLIWLGSGTVSGHWITEAMIRKPST